MEQDFIETENNEVMQEDQLDLSEDDGTLLPDNTFDMTLATTHSYLGDDLEVLRGRTLLDNGIYIDLPLWQPGSFRSTAKMVLFPGQTLPIMEHHPLNMLMIRKCITKDRTFGVACSSLDNSIGTTAEIYEYSEDPMARVIRVKAKGRQRFKILRTRNDTASPATSADVKILPEIVLGPPFFDHRLASLDRLRVIPTDEASAKSQNKVTKQESSLTPWPAWVYHQYDPRRLSMKIRTFLKFVELRGSNIPTDPTELSFWVAQNLIISTKYMMLLLKMDCVIPRLQMEIKLLEKLTEEVYTCKQCRTRIARRADVFPMNQEGLQTAYCNSYGAIHETMTVYQAKSLLLDPSPPSTECSWFPGYAWTIASCSNCYSHVGWRFTATTSDLRPKSFWGLTRNALAWSTPENDQLDEHDNYDQV